jgi:hypothetical protein
MSTTRETKHKLTDEEFYARGLARSGYHDRLFTEGRLRPTNEQFDEGWDAARSFYRSERSHAANVELIRKLVAAIEAKAARQCLRYRVRRIRMGIVSLAGSTRGTGSRQKGRD